VPDEAAAALAGAHAAGSFYVTGGTVPLAAASYVVRRADDDLFHALAAGDYCYVLDTRQMGKSSLMVRAARRLREELGAAVAVLDLTALGQNLTPEQWYDGLLMRLGEQTSLEDELDDYWLENRRLGPMQRLLGALREVALPALAGRRLCVFVDEIDAVRSLPFPADELFAGIRECYNRRADDTAYARLTFCLLGVATPADLIADPRVSPFNVGRRIELRDFTADEAAPLAWGFGVATGGDHLIRRVLHWTGGHPYLTQRLCRALSEEDARPTPALVDRVCRELFFSPRGRESDDNLAFVRNRLLRDPRYRPDDVLTLYAQVRTGHVVPDDPADPHAAILRLSGVAKGDDRGNLAVRNRVYACVFDARWARSVLSAAEVRRQQIAERRALTRAGAFVAAGAGLSGALLWSAWGAMQTAQRDAAAQRAERRRLEGELSAATGTLLRERAESAAHGNAGYARLAPFLPADPARRLVLADAYVAAGAWADAEAAYADVLRHRPGDPAALYGRGRARLGRALAGEDAGRYEPARYLTAVADFDAAARAAPSLFAGDLPFDRGRACYRARLYARAVSDLSRHAAAHPDRAAAWYHLGLAQFDGAQIGGGDARRVKAGYAAAKASLRRYLKLAPKTAPEADTARGLLAQIAAAEQMRGGGGVILVSPAGAGPAGRPVSP
jgi:hypothetical protein